MKCSKKKPENCYMHMSYSKKNPRAHNYGTIVVMKMKREIDV
jgi:hypothetical protein